MQRRDFMGFFLAGPLAGAGLSHAKSRTGRDVPLVGVLAATGLSSLDYLRQGLRAQGYIEGQTVDFAFRSADGNPRDLPGLARHMARLNVDVLFVAGPAALDAAVHATSEVPIVALDLETDPLRAGLVRSLEHPRTNVTGVFLDQHALAGKWLELVRLALPRASQINVLWDASSGPWQLAAIKQAAKQLGLEIDTLVVRDESEFARELTDGMDSKPDALVLLSSPLVRARSAQIAEFCSKNRLPAVSPFGEFPRAGVNGDEAPRCVHQQHSVLEVIHGIHQLGQAPPGLLFGDEPDGPDAEGSCQEHESHCHQEDDGRDGRELLVGILQQVV